ncbi:MAG TPA: non-canonical purine NTP pyrophosphatase [Peptococcaceae bacterium]|nr:MAG: Non-canonical purine NTP pyrophosphatase [Clostridia bacterium 41_269]HBT20374.1 non-canonical purine NTP pyrophosphatase [Peptococcaceae bacterium]
MRKLVIASRNKGKISELKELLKEYNFEILSLDDYPEIPEIKETGKSFKENALIKARIAAQETGCLALADDSGLEVDALGGAPGIYSSRFAGPNKDDEANNKKLLELLEGVPFDKRTARFRCVVAAVDPQGIEITTEGVCEGKIGFEPKGSFGFGYDPIFIVDGYGLTMAELKPEIKNRISHRAKAFKKIAAVLKGLLD